MLCKESKNRLRNLAKVTQTLPRSREKLDHTQPPVLNVNIVFPHGIHFHFPVLPVYKKTLRGKWHCVSFL